MAKILRKLAKDSIVQVILSSPSGLKYDFLMVGNKAIKSKNIFIISVRIAELVIYQIGILATATPKHHLSNFSYFFLLHILTKGLQQ